MDDNTLWEKWKSEEVTLEKVTLEDIQNSLRNSLQRNIIRYYLDSSLEYEEVNKLLNKLVENLKKIEITFDIDNYDDNLETQVETHIMENIEIKINETIENLLKDHLTDILNIYLYEMFDYSLIEPVPEKEKDEDTELRNINDIGGKIDRQVDEIDRFCEKILEIARGMIAPESEGNADELFLQSEIATGEALKNAPPKKNDSEQYLQQQATKMALVERGASGEVSAEDFSQRTQLGSPHVQSDEEGTPGTPWTPGTDVEGNADDQYSEQEIATKMALERDASGDEREVEGNPLLRQSTQLGSQSTDEEMTQVDGPEATQPGKRVRDFASPVGHSKRLHAIREEESTQVQVS